MTSPTPESSIVTSVAIAMRMEIAALEEVYSGDDGEGHAADLESFVVDGRISLPDLARAAIAALRSPTEAMLAAAKPFPEHLRREAEGNADFLAQLEAAVMADRLTVRQHWFDMIDKALES